MSQFVQALRSCRSGESSLEELLSEVDRELTEGRTAAGTLLVLLAREQATAALPPDVHDGITRRISGWLNDHTIVSLPPAVEGAGSAAEADPPATILLNMPEQGDGEASADALPNRAPPVAVGSVLLGRFKLIELVGEGGMSRVYKAVDLRRVEALAQDPYVAVKVMTVPFRDQLGSLAVLQREAHKLQSLTHPNIVRVIDCDRDGQTVFMTMEFLDGEPLHRKLQSGISRAQAAAIVVGIANALEFAHRTGIVHGDLKPGNVIITVTGETKVIDFGIARFIARPTEADADGGGLSNTWEALNALTPPYASPEMLEGKEADPTDDVYALACIAYETLTGRHPFDRMAATTARDAGLKPVRQGGINGRQFKAVLGGLRFDRKRRTATVQQFIDQLTGSRARATRRLVITAGLAAVGIGAAAFFFSRQSLNEPIARSAATTPMLTPGTVFRDCPTCPLMRVLPPGRFSQGAIGGAPFEQPQHDVAIDYRLAMAPREITVGEFQEFIDDTARDVMGCATYDGEWRQRPDVDWRIADDAQTALHPVSCVSWSDADAYVQWLSQRTGRRYRLPSSSEWEYAARAGAVGPQPWNDESTACSIGNVADQRAASLYPGWQVHDCNDNYAKSAPVGTFRANAFGLRDMIGNVFEWVGDCWHDNYVGAPRDGTARIGGECAEREMRGGSWFTPPAYISLSYRNRFAESYRSSSVGFRVVREIDE